MPVVFELGFKILPWPTLFGMATTGNTKELLHCALHITFPTLKDKRFYITRAVVMNRKVPINDINWENLIRDSYDTVIFNA